MHHIFYRNQLNDKSRRTIYIVRIVEYLFFSSIIIITSIMNTYAKYFSAMKF